MDRLRLFHQRECLKCNGHGLSVSCVKWFAFWCELSLLATNQVVFLFSRLGWNGTYTPCPRHLSASLVCCLQTLVEFEDNALNYKFLLLEKNSILFSEGGSHWVPSPTHVSKYQHGGKVPTFEPQYIMKTWLNIIKVESLLFDVQIST